MQETKYTSPDTFRPLTKKMNTDINTSTVQDSGYTDPNLKKDSVTSQGIVLPEKLHYLASLSNTDNNETWKDRLYGYSLMVWDGLGFFGTDHTKLGRLKGVKVNFCTPFKNYRLLVLSILGFVIVMIVIIMEANKIGTRKSQTISLI